MGKIYQGLEFWEREAFLSGCMVRIAPEKDVEIRAEIEKDVLEWLKDDKADSVFECNFCDGNGKFIPLPIVLWRRAEIYIKNCVNGWEVWRIAVSSAYDKMLSYKVKEVGTNDIQAVTGEFKMPNEIRSQGSGIWGLI